MAGNRDEPPMSGSDAERIREVLAYHERSKHHLQRYARGPDHLDWANQPDPFRTFAGAPIVELPLLADAVAVPYDDLYRPRVVPPRRLDRMTLAIFFELSLGLSAWKQYRSSRWALRCNPSSGNLHPTEGYVIVPEMPELPAGVYHYVSRDHCLEQRCALAADSLPGHAFLVGLSSVHWREAWKYGERAYRYCQHDVGHAVAAIRFAGACLGWTVVLLDEPSDRDVAALLGLDDRAAFAGVDEADREHPDLLLLVRTQTAQSVVDRGRLSKAVAQRPWSGTANRLSRQHVRYPIIEGTAEACRKPRTLTGDCTPEPAATEACDGRTSRLVPAATLIRQRRSCLGLDGQTAIPAATLYAMLDRLLPRPGVPPWDALPWSPHLHLGLFVHRVTGLPSGLYVLERTAAIHDRLRGALRERFVWERPIDCPPQLRLYCLAAGDLRDEARTVSCHQEIASDGAFSLGMIADFGESIRAKGAWWYRRLFWEAGVLGQVLYLEAEAAGVRGTGIGCYFDDAFHQLLGIRDDRFQSLYHFTVGGPVEDPRLQTIAPYAQLRR